MANARSTVLGALVVSDLNVHVLATCPPGYTVIVKDVHLVNGGTIAVNINVSVHRPGPINVFLLTGSVQGGAIESWQGWVVLEAGDELWCAISGASASFWASGSVLVGQAPPT